jgi:hypothetical protein
MKPVEITISKKVRALVGFKDDRVEIRVKVPVLGEVPLAIQPEDMGGIDKVQDAYKAWMARCGTANPRAISVTLSQFDCKSLRGHPLNCRA